MFNNVCGVISILLESKELQMVLHNQTFPNFYRVLQSRPTILHYVLGV